MTDQQNSCPLCGKMKHMRKAKALYGHLVCRKCYYGFTNRRQLAFFVDITCWRFLMLPVAFSSAIALEMVRLPRVQAELTLTGILYLFFLIYSCKDCFNGQSLGKAICGVKVIDVETGNPGGILTSFKRNLPLLIPFMPLIVAFRLSKGHRIGDGWAKSKVIWKKYEDSPVFATKLGGIKSPV